MDPIYLDYNATTPVDREVLDAMLPFLTGSFGNPGSVHHYGRESKKAVMDARQRVARFLGAEPDEVIFTSSGTESNNLAIRGVATAMKDRGRHIITSSVEHPAVLEVCKYLEDWGYVVDYLPVDASGVVDPEALKSLIRPDTILISVMHANNETGVIQPIRDLSAIAREHGVIFHTDAAQSAGKIEVDVEELGVDLLSLAGHKFHAPKGIGALYIRRGTPLTKLLFGADHEMDLRPGTENVPSIVGLGVACDISKKGLTGYKQQMREMTERFFRELKEKAAPVERIGHPEKRLPNTINIGFPGIEAEILLHTAEGIAASAGAACHAGITDVSHVLRAMNVPENIAMGSVRFSFGKFLKDEEVSKAVSIISGALESLRSEKGKVSAAHPDREIRITEYSTHMGCSCKTSPVFLKHLLGKMPENRDSRILVGNDTSDDAAVFRLDDKRSVVQTVDFITPVVDNPFDFGGIAMANALSDVYAMGAEPLFALNVVGFPSGVLPASILEEMMKGASDVAGKAGISILGGHTVDDREIKFGMCVTGIVDNDRVIRNSTPRPGDSLILTKPLGTGIILAGMKRGLVGNETVQKVTRTMLRLNDVAGDLMRKYNVHACTDVTGFGLLGHLSEMLRPPKLGSVLKLGNIPVMKEGVELSASGITSGGTKNNRDYCNGMVRPDQGIPEHQLDLLYDPQTSGGLLISLPGNKAPRMVDDLHKAGLTDARIIGTIISDGKISIQLIH